MENIVLQRGAHKTREEGMCVMELAAFLAGEEHSDHPKCVSPVIGAFLRQWNDDLDSNTRQQLKPWAYRILGTAGNPEQEARRAWLALDWLIRTYAPAWLRCAGLEAHALALSSLAPCVDQATLEAGETTLTAAWDATRDTAWDAVWVAARDMAWAAAWAAIKDAAWDTAWDAARDATWAAAKAATQEKIDPTVRDLQQSAFDLLDAMIRA